MTLCDLDISCLHPDPRNANVCDAETQAKLTRHIQNTGICPALLVRPYPKKKGHYVLIDGHHRWMIVKTLGWETVPCQVVDVDANQAGLLLLTLNRLRGEDVPRKRAELIESLLPHWGVKTLATLLPETDQDIQGLLALLAFDEAAQAERLREQMAQEAATLPVPFGFMVTADEAVIVRETLAKARAQGAKTDSDAWIYVCQSYLSIEG